MDVENETDCLMIGIERRRHNERRFRRNLTHWKETYSINSVDQTALTSMGSIRLDFLGKSLDLFFNRRTHRQADRLAVSYVVRSFLLFRIFFVGFLSGDHIQNPSACGGIFALFHRKFLVFPWRSFGHDGWLNLNDSRRSIGSHSNEHMAWGLMRSFGPRFGL